MADNKNSQSNYVEGYIVVILMLILATPTILHAWADVQIRLMKAQEQYGR